MSVIPADLRQLDPPVKVLEVDLSAVTGPIDVGEGYHWARVLLRRGASCGPVVLVPVQDAVVLPETLLAAADSSDLQWKPDPVLPAELTVAVAIPTRDRPESLRRALISLRANAGTFEILVVDNAPSDSRTQEVVDECAAEDPRIRYLLEPIPGASAARNAALRTTDADVVVFTDDDVEVDRHWVAAHASSFADPDVCVSSGPGYAAELETSEDMMAEATLGFSKGPEPQRYRLSDPPEGAPLFPWTPGLFGGSLNLAVRTSHARRIGGFDEALGAGVITRGGEDGDFTVRTVRSGAVLVYTPDAVVWHHHRQGAHAFTDQVLANAAGLGALLTKFATTPDDVLGIVSRLPAAAKHMVTLRQRSSEGGFDQDLRRRELVALAQGPYRYFTAHRAVRARNGNSGRGPLSI